MFFKRPVYPFFPIVFEQCAKNSKAQEHEASNSLEGVAR